MRNPASRTTIDAGDDVLEALTQAAALKLKRFNQLLQGHRLKGRSTRAQNLRWRCLELD